MLLSHIVYVYNITFEITFHEFVLRVNVFSKEFRNRCGNRQQRY